MKRHGNLWKDITKYSNIQLAHKLAKRGKGFYSEVKMVDRNQKRLLKKLQKSLLDKTFSTSAYTTFKVYRPKEREIFKLPYYPDRIVQHALLNVIAPIWVSIFIYDVYSAIPDKGIHRAIDRLKWFLKDKKNTQYCLQFDIAKFYPSVAHKVLKELIRRKIKCSNTLWLLDNIIDSPPGDKGIPIGNYTSQYFANIYLNWFDHFLKQKLRLKHYIRYADDGIILSSSKAKLHSILNKISSHLKSLKLELNPKTQIYPVDKRGIDFLGYRTFRDYILLRKKSVKKLKSKIRLIKSNHRKLSSQHIVSSIMSYVGWIQHCDGYNLLKKFIFEDETLMKLLDKSSSQLGFENPLRRKYAI